VNAPLRRSKGQLHIHIDCVRRNVREALHRLAPEIGDRWTTLSEPLVGRRYRAVRVLGVDLGDTDPFRLLASDGDVQSAMGEHSLVVVGADFAGQWPGFVVLDGRVTSRFGKASNAENLQDHSCDLEPDSVSTP
jgi:CDP-diacylglycerol pyrophosphatase